MAEAEPGTAGGYVAFISYSHKDAAMGRWLHRKLEGYRLPKRLAGTMGEDGEVPARLTPIFRDRDELPAAGDLSERVRAALAVSRNLIVLCSPNSAASPWVAKEIATFRELHPGRPVFTAIVEGEPGQCFSPTLLEGGAEPLAADLRKEGDGRRLGFLKLVAGLAGVGLDALIQRDAARRVRRVTYVTAAAVTAMLAMALLTASALNARAEAVRQRAEAEGLVEFMLTDLRRELRGVGRLDIMSAVNTRALAYYERHQAQGRPLAVSAVRARVDHTIGEDLLTRGDAEGALRHFRRAHGLTSALIEAASEDPQIVFAHAQSEFWIGRVHELRRQWSPAQRQYARFAALTDRLIAIAPANQEYMMQVGWSAIDLGNVQLNGLRDYAGAQRTYEKAVHWFGRAVAVRRSDESALRAQANAYAWLSDSFFMRARWPEALAARQRQYRIVERLHRANPANVENGYRLAVAQRAVARTYFKVGDRASARTRLFEAYDWTNRLSQRDPGNAEWRLFKTFVRCDLLFAGLGLPDGVNQGDLRTEITSVARALRAEANPRAQELAPCVNAIERGSYT
ncbi:MAG TPA: toll/interleukin-1 receptor domain-containing protein [Allosphingosinicella sp.]|jgi:tetratricopeptide (TPR) repeat protein